MKKVLRLVKVAAVATTGVVALAGCSQGKAAGIKVGLILLHPHDKSTYDRNFYDGLKSAAKELGFKFAIREDIPEGPEVTTAAQELVDSGCDMVFADSFGHESYLMEAATNNPNITFCHATGTQAAGSGLNNFYDAFASIYEGRYLAGVVAGHKLAEMMEADGTMIPQVGYVGAFPYAEVISGFTSWFLGVRSVVEDAEMTVRFTGSWYDETGEYNTAKQLIEEDGCVLISQHADSYGAPNACEEAGVPNVSYNYSTEKAGPNTYLVASKIDWSAYFKHVVNAIVDAKANGTSPVIKQDYVGSLADGGVKITALSKNCAAGTQEDVDAKAEAIKAGTLHVFDVTKFTVNGGETPTNDNCAPSKQWTFNYEEGTEFIKDGYYHESEYRSAPYFDFIIDGITAIQ